MRQRNSLAELFDSLMTEGLNSYSEVNRGTFYARPALNILETANEYKVQYAVPGMTKDNVEVKLDEDQRLMVSVGKKEEKKEENSEETAVAEKKEETTTVRYLRRDFAEYSFTQKFNLPEDIDHDNISATMENGLLDIRIPKRTEEQKAKLQRSISIN